ERTGKVPVGKPIGKPVGKPEGKSDGFDGVGHPVGRQDSGDEGTGDEDDGGQSGKKFSKEDVAVFAARLKAVSLDEFLHDKQEESDFEEVKEDGDEVVTECVKCGRVADAIYIMVERMRTDGKVMLGPGGVKAVLPHTVDWNHEQVDVLIELMAVADTLGLTLPTLCKLITGRYVKSKADNALGMVHPTYDLVKTATKTMESRFSNWTWEEIRKLSGLYTKQVEAVRTPPVLQQVPVAAQNMPGTGLGGQSVAGGIGGGAGRQGQDSGRQLRGSGTGGCHVSRGSHESSKGVKRHGTGSRNEEFDEKEEDDDVVEMDSPSKRNTGNNTVVKIIEREKKKKSFRGAYNVPRYRIGDTSSTIG
ncbi:hypothetical protein HDV00_001042, partial [Rhizophlyctis rosea]